MKKIILLVTVIFLLNSCSKDDSNNIENPEEQSAEIKENVVVILEENSELISSEIDLSNGIYTIKFSGEVPKIENGEIIVGEQGEGFLRKVTNSSVNGNTITLETVQAKMEDVFKDATIEFNTDLSNRAKSSKVKSNNYKVNYLAKGVKYSGNNIEFDFSNTILYEENGLKFEIKNGKAIFNPNFSFKGDYSLFGGIKYIDFKANNAELDVDLDISLSASANINLASTNTTLADIEKKITFLVGSIPVVVIVNTTLVAEFNANIDSKFDITTGYKNNYLFSTNAKYENGDWTGNYDLNTELISKPIQREGEVNISQNLTIIPKVSFKFYGIVGPYCEPKVTKDFEFNIASPSLDWDSNLKVGLDLTTGVEVDLFGYNIADFSRTDNFEEIIWSAPETIEIISGNNQVGNQNEQLTEYLKVKVTDKLNNPLSNVPIYFNVTQGDGSVDNETIMSDNDGFAEVYWTLGNNTDTQTIEVTFKKANGNTINESLITFQATLNTKEERLFGVTESEKIVEININTGNEINTIITFGSKSYSNFAYIESTNEIVCFEHSSNETYKINVSNGTSTQLTSNYYVEFIVDNKNNRLFGVTESEKIVEIDINTGNEINTIITFGSKSYSNFAYIESTNEIVCFEHSSNETYKINVSNGTSTQLTSNYYVEFIVDNKNNRLFGVTESEKIVEIDINTGNEINTIITFGSKSYSNFAYIESTNEIVCLEHSSNETYKINVSNGTSTQLTSNYYVEFIVGRE